MSRLGIDGSQGMQSIPNNIHRFFTLVASLATVTVYIVVDAYLLPFNVQSSQGKFAITRQFSGIDAMQDIVAKEPGLVEMMKNIHQKMYLLNKRE